MTQHHTHTPAAALRNALRSTSPAQRLHVAIAAGSRPSPAYAEVLVEQCAVEPNFSVREMLTWALTRHDPDDTLALLADAVQGDEPQARSQALHTLSKIGAPQSWSVISEQLLADEDDEVARTAWRAAVALVPAGEEESLAMRLVSQLGRGDHATQRSLSRAFVDLGEHAAAPVTDAASYGPSTIRAHAAATLRLMESPDDDFDDALFEARRMVAILADPTRKE